LQNTKPYVGLPEAEFMESPRGKENHVAHSVVKGTDILLLVLKNGGCYSDSKPVVLFCEIKNYPFAYCCCGDMLQKMLP
jgi:hypothetical protein